MISDVTPLAVAVMEGDVEAMVWLMQLFDEKGLDWRDDGSLLSLSWPPSRGEASSRA